MNHIEEVLGRLDRTGLTVKRNKCEWGKEELKFLGNCIGKGKVCISSRHDQLYQTCTEERRQSLPGNHRILQMLHSSLWICSL